MLTGTVRYRTAFSLQYKQRPSFFIALSSSAVAAEEEELCASSFFLRLARIDSSESEGAEIVTPRLLLVYVDSQGK